MPFRLRSFVRRGGLGTQSQARARRVHWSAFGLQTEDGMLSQTRIFGRHAPLMVEVGFGSGQSLLALAAACPEKDFIGIETHKPGIGSVLLGIHSLGLTNLRLYDADALDVFTQCIPDASLACCQLFFPDPWQKRRHHARRLIQPAFIQLVSQKLQAGGELHLATDWEDYAGHMQQVLSNESSLLNIAGARAYSVRSPHRPVVTKFEGRALREGRTIRDLCFVKV